mmetsp:Transcript_10068/g.14214  ORF Transcript_10068/g.14214 Transcript_10068/m.14214 type:complete len:99 (+) Transcript_10068:107-403(+)
MVVVEDVLNEALSQTVKSWFASSFSHPFLDLETLVVAESTAPIPKRWVDEVRIDEGFFRVASVPSRYGKVSDQIVFGTPRHSASTPASRASSPAQVLF